MALSPLDIRSQSFTRRMRGFDTDEVGAFLSILAEHYDDLQREVRHSESRIADLEAKLVHYERIEEALQEALRTARESQRSALDTAAQQAEQIRTEARLEARSVVQEAEHDRNRLRQEAQAIGARRKEIVARLRAFLMSEMEMLAHFEGEDPIGFIQLRRDTAASLGPSAPLGGTLGTFESDAEIAARRAAAAPAPGPADPDSADDLWAAPSVVTGDEAVPVAAPVAVPETDAVHEETPADDASALDAPAYEAPYTARLDVEDPDTAAAVAESHAPANRNDASSADAQGGEAATAADSGTGASQASSRLASETHGTNDAASVPTDRPGYAPAPPEWTFAPEPDEELIPEPPVQGAEGFATYDPAPDIHADEPTLVRPSWMDEVPDDLLAAPLVEAASVGQVPDVEPARLSGLPDLSGGFTHEAPPAHPGPASPLAERLARAASEAPSAAPPAAPLPTPVSAMAPEPVRPRYVVTSFLGDDEAADAAPPAAAPQAESEEIARVRRLLDGLG